MTWFTDHDIFNELIIKLKNGNYEAFLIVLNDGINNKKEGLNFQKFIDCGGVFHYSDIENLVHHKFCIIDGREVITGSYNWTYYAENRNWENVVILNDLALVNGYNKEFEKLLHHHNKVLQINDDIAKKTLLYNSDNILQTDYICQAHDEEKKGNEISVAKIYTQLLRLNDSQQLITDARNSLLKRINLKQFKLCPFEIGIQMKNTYFVVIEACEILPFKTRTWQGNASTNVNQSHVLTIKRKQNGKHILLKEITINHAGVQPLGTPIVDYHFFLDQTGILVVFYKELKGSNKQQEKKIDLRSVIS